MITMPYDTPNNEVYAVLNTYVMKNEVKNESPDPKLTLNDPTLKNGTFKNLGVQSPISDNNLIREQPIRESQRSLKGGPDSMNGSRDIKLTLANPDLTIDHNKSTPNKDKDLCDPNREKSNLTDLD